MSIVNVPDVAQRLEPSHINHQVTGDFNLYRPRDTPYRLSVNPATAIDKFTAYHNGSNSGYNFLRLKCLFILFYFFFHCLQEITVSNEKSAINTAVTLFSVNINFPPDIRLRLLQVLYNMVCAFCKSRHRKIGGWKVQSQMKGKLFSVNLQCS